MADSGAVRPQLIAGRYELDVLIGTGGIAEVWRAKHLALNSFVAIKFLQGASAQNESSRRRFTAEAQITAQLKSQHAVQVFDFGITDDGHPYLVMELLEGETVGRRIERLGALGVLETARILGQSARALHRAHQIGIVHRDFKPDNIVIGADDEGRDYVKVLDFGIAKLLGNLETPQASEVLLEESAPTTTFTKTGAILGTPFYMAPEQVRNASGVDLRADIWAFGVVAFECLTGRTPFSGKTLAELFQNIERGVHPGLRELQADVPHGFDAWFDTACAPEAAKRFGDAQTAWRELVIALGCGSVDLDSPLQRASAPTKGPPRVVASSPESADEHAATLVASNRFGVAPRKNRSQRRISAARPVEALQPISVSDPPVARTLSERGLDPAKTSVEGSGRGASAARTRMSRARFATIGVAMLGVTGGGVYLQSRAAAPTASGGTSETVRPPPAPPLSPTIDPTPAAVSAIPSNSPAQMPVGLGPSPPIPPSPRSRRASPAAPPPVVNATAPRVYASASARPEPALPPASPPAASGSSAAPDPASYR